MASLRLLKYKPTGVINKYYDVDVREHMKTGDYVDLGPYDAMKGVPKSDPKPEKVDESVDFKSYTVKELRVFAELAEIDPDGLKKPELIEELIKADYKPED